PATTQARRGARILRCFSGCRFVIGVRLGDLVIGRILGFPRILGGFRSGGLVGYRIRFHRRIIRVVRGQPAGASISFHPSSPVVRELLTEYLEPSGPVTSPLIGL